MTEDEFKKVMGKIVGFIIIALIILIIVGVFVFNKSGKSLSIFKDKKELNSYKEKVQEVNSSNTVADGNTTSTNNSVQSGENVVNTVANTVTNTVENTTAPSNETASNQ